MFIQPGVGPTGRHFAFIVYKYHNHSHITEANYKYDRMALSVYKYHENPSQAPTGPTTTLLWISEIPMEMQRLQIQIKTSVSKSGHHIVLSGRKFYQLFMEEMQIR